MRALVGLPVSAPFQADFTVSFEGYSVSSADVRFQADGQMRLQIDWPTADAGINTYSAESFTETLAAQGKSETVSFARFKEVDTFTSAGTSISYAGLISTTKLGQQTGGAQHARRAQDPPGG